MRVIEGLLGSILVVGLSLTAACAPDLDAPLTSSAPTRPGSTRGGDASTPAGDDDDSTDAAEPGAEPSPSKPTDREAEGPLMGRTSFVATMMSDRTANAAWVRLAEYQLAEDGTVAISYWQWDQSIFTGDATTNKVATATTKGCLRSCTVKTPLGFQRGTKPKTATGTFKVDDTGFVTVTWNKHVETWSATNLPTLTKMALASSSDGARLGYAFGSKAPLDRGVGIDEVAAAKLITGPYYSNAYDAATTLVTDKIGFSDWARCSVDPSLEVKTNVDPDKTKWWNAYIAGDPALDGRKMFWNHERGVVTQAQSPGATCISVGGGHTVALLQVLDDAGTFQGWVSAEASQHGRYKGGDVVSIAALMKP